MQKAISVRNRLFIQMANMLNFSSSPGSFYKAMNYALYQIRDEYTMLHFPLYVDESDDFLKAQENLTRYCMSFIETLDGKSVLEIGCGNGVQALFIANHYKPKSITGIDINQNNIEIAKSEKIRRGFTQAFFLVDDAQKMTNIDDQSFDVVINIESALHYPDKQAFLNELYRVLKPGGHFLIADVLTNRNSLKNPKKRWESKLNLNQWNLDQYHEGLKNASLKVNTFENITDRILSGFRNYPSFFRQMRKRNVFRSIVFKMFLLINVKFNIYLFRTSRQYVIFSGIKPAII